MATSTKQNEQRTDEFGIERAHADDPGFIDKYREKWEWFDHIMRMQQRYSKNGGNQYAAGITYFSVLSMFPILMLSFAIAAMVLVRQPELLERLQDRIAEALSGTLGDTVNEILDTAIEQRSVIFGVGGLTALWSGLSWMNHLRYGASKMWHYPVSGGNFIMHKLRDLLGLIGLMVAMFIAFGVTAVGSSGLTQTVLEWLHLDEVPGISYLTFGVTLLVGLIANYLVFLWMLKYLPRGEVPMKVAAKAALLGAVAFEVFKQIGSLFFSKALDNPAGATFGPIIGVMVLLYFVWRIYLYCCAWAATTPEALAIAKLDAPGPAVIHVREVVKPDTSVLAVGSAAISGVRDSIKGLFKR
ncbi:YhjD/YihY/BrkB family envelope integrity protein [Corynebacterium pseudopelargi]|uniref:Inner membrane protein YhjD n=1 Tax=Corynebacterium pseudopelargi TaxID=2080757 RepID=A0A3G6IWD5_9CORY|nr:YhjD/YihY/BrkB family envelope integrity protein [Corynebacterium pseudopelargi]AZA09873.1 Inner membrane protein YhjD [Corynebacterium pseudopelargi]